MLDLLLGFSLAFLLVRGWFRGFVREAFDLAGLILGAVLAFRLGGPVGRVLHDMSGVSEDLTRLAGGVIVFFAVGLGAALAARAVERAARLPGLNLVNRVTGAALAGLWGVFLATLALTLLAVLPLPGAVASQVDDSAVSRTLTDPGGVPQRLFSGLSGDRVVGTLLELRDAVGARRVMLEGDEVLVLPPADPARLESDHEAAFDVYERLNRARVDAGEDPLAWAPALAEVAAGYARQMYLTGRFAHADGDGSTASERLAAAGLTYRVAGENLALAATSSDVHRGLLDSPGHRANMLAPEFRRVGVAVVSGPLGLMTVQVFTG